MQSITLKPENESAVAQNREGGAGLLYLYLIVLVAAVGGFLYGYEIQLISSAIIYLEEDFQLSPEWKGEVMGSAILGCAFGPLAGVWLADKFGRKKSLVFSSVAFLASAIGCALAPTIQQFNAWRFIGGMGIGLAATVSPMYIAEVAPARMRGTLVLVNQLAVVVGGMLSVVVAYFLSFGGHWRWMFASQAVPIFGLIIGLIFVPESPRWMAIVGRTIEALKILTRINGASRAETELSEIQAELGCEQGTFSELLLPGIRISLIIGALVMIFSQICGVIIVHIYAPSLFLESGAEQGSEAIFNSIYICIWAAVCTMVSFAVIRSFGRRPILIVGSLAMALGHISLFICFMTHASTIVTLLAMMFTSASFTLTLAPLSWVVLSEIFPNRVRGKAMSIATIIMFAASYFTVKEFPPMTDWFKSHYSHPGGAFLIFAVICIGCAIFIWRMLPETKDKTLEEIGQFWLKRTKH